MNEIKNDVSIVTSQNNAPAFFGQGGEDLPVEIQMRIIAWIAQLHSEKDVLSLAETNRHLRQLCFDDPIWDVFSMRHFPHSFAENSSELTGPQLYKQLRTIRGNLANGVYTSSQFYPSLANYRFDEYQIHKNILFGLDRTDNYMCMFNLKTGQEMEYSPMRFDFHIDCFDVRGDNLILSTSCTKDVNSTDALYHIQVIDIKSHDLKYVVNLIFDIQMQDGIRPSCLKAHGDDDDVILTKADSVVFVNIISMCHKTISAEKNIARFFCIQGDMLYVQREDSSISWASLEATKAFIDDQNFPITINNYFVSVSTFVVFENFLIIWIKGIKKIVICDTNKNELIKEIDFSCYGSPRVLFQLHDGRLYAKAGFGGIQYWDFTEPSKK